MASNADRRKLKAQLERQVERMEEAERESPGAWAQSAMLGVLGLLIVIPVVAGAYLGRWIDHHWADGNGRWTLAMILVGVVVGAMNTYLYLRE